MDKYIKQLLEVYSKIILPQFGAIVIEDEETGELMFNEYLTYDDGKLSELIEKESNMDIQEAKNLVAKFVRELQAQLDKGETYAIFQLGEFSKSKDGEVIFNGNLKTGALENKVTPTPPISEQKNPTAAVEVEKKSKEEEPIKKVEKSTVKSDDTSKKNIYVEKKDTFPKSDSDTVKNADSEKIEPKEKTLKPKKEKIKKEKLIVPPKVKTPKKPKEPKKPREEKEKKKRSPFFWIILILLILVATASILIGLNYEKVEEYMGWNKFDVVENTDDHNSLIEDEIVPEENETIEEEEFIDEPVEEVIKEEPKKETNTPIASQTSKGNHHIIVGCFSELSNAQSLVDEFKQQGFDSKIVGQYGGLHFVSAQSYPTSSEAYTNLNRVRNVKDSAWLFSN
ncbi:MAG TPA: SPOR domain-containing protein [Brumimicrobium sp.]|nr:SPOR domain-containing protein [Brumimicrobium sp.]